MENSLVLPYKRVILLGSTGFLGRAISRVLRDDGLHFIGYGSADLDLRKFDMLHRLNGSLDKDTALIVASALTPDKGATLDVLQENFLMCGNVARYLESHSISVCVYISSDAVYPFRFNPITESTPVEPGTFYALAKYAGERMFARLGEISGTRVLLLRLTGLYGPGDPHGSYGPNGFMRSIVTEKVVRLFGEGEEFRDHLHVDDAARLIRQLLASQATGIYNVASGQSLSFAEIIEILRHVVPWSFRTVSLARKAPITHRRFDVSRLFLQVPMFKPTSIEQGLAEYYRCCMEGK